MSHKLASFLLISVFATSGTSETMFGQSNTSCIAFLSNHDEHGKQLPVRDWLDGYFSGRIRETGRELSIVSNLDIPLYELLLKACRNDPNLNLSQSADRVYTIIP